MNEQMRLGKKEELAILKEAIAKLGTDTYLGLWLRQTLGEVESAIRSDICPEAMGISIASTRTECEAMVAKATEEASEIRRMAHEDAAKTRGLAIRGARETKERAAAVVREALRSLES